MYKKLKSYLHDDTLFIACLIILIGVISFGLGRKSVLSADNLICKPKNDPGVVFYDVCNKDANAREFQGSDTQVKSLKLVASKTGTKYHLPDCPGVSQIKKENIIYFNSIELAEAAGYQPAANCPALN